MSDWISVEDRLPKIKDKLLHSSESEDVLALNCDGNMYVANLNFYAAGGYRKEDEYSWSDKSTGCGCCSEGIQPSHWMSLPKPPEQ